MIEFKVIGAENLAKRLESIPVKLEARILRGAVRAAAKAPLEKAKATAPNRKGALRDSLRISTRAKPGQVKASVVAGDKKKGGVYYAMFVEAGTKAHLIKPKLKKSLKFGGRFAKSVAHPGAKAKPFMAPALKSTAQEGINTAAKYIERRLDKLVK